MPYEHRRDTFTVSTDPARLDVDAIHAFLSTSYWAEGIPRDLVARSLERSLCFGLYEGERQIGLARVISDLATFAYLCDVYVLSEYRGRGLGQWLMRCVMEHPDLAGLRRFHLVTATLTSSTGSSGSPRSRIRSVTWRSRSRISTRPRMVPAASRDQ